MTELNFKIVAIASLYGLEVTEDELREYIRRCNMSVQSFALAKVKTSDDQDYPEIEEYVYDVRAKYVSHFLRRKIDLYSELCTSWREVTKNASASKRPILILYENGSFINTRRAIDDDVACHEVSFGTLPHSGPRGECYLKYENLKAENFPAADFHHDTRTFEIKYRCNCFNYKMTTSYNNIRKIFVNPTSPCEIYFDLQNPPLLFRVDTKRVKRFTYGEPSTYEINARVHSAGISASVLAHANVLRIKVSDWSLAQEILGRIHFRCSEKPVYYCAITTVVQQEPTSLTYSDMSHFGCNYMLVAILSRNYSVVEQAGASLSQYTNLLNSYVTENPASLEKALSAVLLAVDSGKLINYWKAIQEQYAYYLSNKDQVNFSHYLVPEKCRLIRRVTVTPTRTLLWPPELMCENRVLRRFDSEYALRVSFRDDNMSRLSFNALYAHEDIFVRSIRNPMLQGIAIGPRRFQFLAWSNSQIRDHGVWMYARDKQGNDPASIRAWMGDFSHIRTVPKYMARMGQCFSQTEDAIHVPLNPGHVVTEKDIEGGFDSRNCKPYCFSDGIGRISSQLAEKVHDALGHDKHCSAFQIRYGGYKGMLTVDPTLKHTDIVFRMSMKKFDAQSDRLEIAKTSAPTPLQLNRPFITILNDMGVRHNTFLRLQENMLRSLTNMLLYENEAAAYLRSKTPSDLFKYKDLSQSGVSLTTEPFFRSLLLALHRHSSDMLKNRANIFIDPSKGRNMLGVLDETGRLNYGQVFVQYTVDISAGQTTKETTILRGEVMVTKNPCHQPGDIRKFQAVDIPQLRHIVDCIVFPQNGPRPHPSEMAGSDLDGDEYAVVWDKDLIFHRANDDPAHFPSVTIPEVSPIKVEHMVNFLMEYIKNDQVGVIANAHLSRADKEGIFSDVCKRIADKFSVAVDFPKNGKSEHLEVHERPQEFPDFMEKNYKISYKSKKALGKLYRVCKDFETENEKASINYPSIQPDPDLAYPGWEKYKESAIKSRNKYNSLLRHLLRNYGIEHEAEAFSSAFTNLHCRFQERKDRAEIEKVIIACIKKLGKSMKEEFLAEFKSATDLKSVQTSLLQKASAWYMVTYSDPQATFLSFPWIVSQYLANVKLLKNPSSGPVQSPLTNEMERQIEEAARARQLPEHGADKLFNYHFICARRIVENAISVLVLWGQEDQGGDYLVEIPGMSRRGLLYLSTFVDLILHVATLEGYVAKRGSIASVKKQEFSSAALCLAFFRFCVSLRFYSKDDVRRVLPFDVYKYSALSKRAVVTYHALALSGRFNILSFTNDIQEIFETDFYTNNIFGGFTVDAKTLEVAQERLEKATGVEYVRLRYIRQTKKICVSTSGTEHTVKSLKRLLRHKAVLLRQFFASGVLPDELKVF